MLRLVLPLLVALLPWSVVGGPNIFARVIGGSSANISNAFYQANIIVDGSTCCSGAIISTKTILTAAECVNDYYAGSIRVRVGTSFRESGGIPAIVCEVIVHPEYTYWRYDNNLALLKLCEPLKTSKTVNVIKVIESLPADDTQAQVTGWGSTSWWDSWWDTPYYGNLPDRLQSASLTIYNREKCASDLGVWFGLWDNGISDRTLCTYKDGKGGCSYDAGAPLVKDKKLVGILSQGGCTTKPDVYASVIKYKDWLDTNTKGEDAKDEDDKDDDQKGTPTGMAVGTTKPVETATDSAIGTATVSSTGTATVSSTGIATDSPTGTATESATGTATDSPTGTATDSATGTATASPTGTATDSPTGTATDSPTGTATDSPTGTATDSATGTATVSSTGTATVSATGTPESFTPMAPGT